MCSVPSDSLTLPERHKATSNPQEDFLPTGLGAQISITHPFTTQGPPEAGRQRCNLCLLNKLIAFYSIFSTFRTEMLLQERAGCPFSLEFGAGGWGAGVVDASAGQRPVGPGPLFSAWPVPSRRLEFLALEGTEYVSVHPCTLLSSRLGNVSGIRCRTEQLLRHSKEVNK